MLILASGRRWRRVVRSGEETDARQWVVEWGVACLLADGGLVAHGDRRGRFRALGLTAEGRSWCVRELNLPVSLREELSR